jgi:hypothetical protein
MLEAAFDYPHIFPEAGSDTEPVQEPADAFRSRNPLFGTGQQDDLVPFLD